VGEWTTASFGKGEGNRVTIDSEIKFPHSLGLLYSAFTYYTGFKVNSAEYKVMGLAPYGEPKYTDLILKELIDLKEDGSFKLNMKYFNYCTGLTMTNDRFHKLFGAPPRRAETQIRQRDMDLARSVQAVTEEVMLRMARHVHEVTGEENLCLSGGVALNCVANGRISREGPFKRLWIQPAAGDAGGALGAALIAWHHYLEKPRTVKPIDSQSGSFLGPVFSDSEVETFLKSQGADYDKCTSEQMIEKTAKLIEEGNVIGWFQGRMEFGPRALGARSIIGDARNRDMQSRMNLKIKFRESFRPFAPSVLQEEAPEWFDTSETSPYMLLVADISTKHRLSSENGSLKGLDKLKEIRSKVPAITHVDYSARLQTVDSDRNPVYHALIKKFHEKTGCPVIINTSFNVRGEPIVCKPEDAFRCFMRTEMDYLILGNFILDKKKQKEVSFKKEETYFELD
jgi:carbamoyltransferase